MSFFESVLRDHSKDHAVAVVYFDDTLTAEPYTTLLDLTRAGRREGDRHAERATERIPDRSESCLWHEWTKRVAA